jgi:16S rRNA G1207 methylase RsmC
MRLAAQVRGGFYPAHEKAIAHAASFLRAPVGDQFAILDPCAGQGAVIRQLGELLGCAPTQIFAIELDDSRADAMHQALPEAHVLAPADFSGCRASPNSFSFIWLNPPFDDSYGGHRVEERFLWRATDWLMPSGVMALVCPENVVDQYSNIRRFFTAHYQQCTIVPFQEAHRPFREVIVFGHKRLKPMGDRNETSGT